jgi:hypothetical protein
VRQTPTTLASEPRLLCLATFGRRVDTTLSKTAKQKSTAAPKDAAVKTVKQGSEKESTSSATERKPLSDSSD